MADTSNFSWMQRAVHGLFWPLLIGVVAIWFLMQDGDANFFWFWRVQLGLSAVLIVKSVISEFRRYASRSSFS
jgi:hypothetical protein